MKSTKSPEGIRFTLGSIKNMVPL